MYKYIAFVLFISSKLIGQNNPTLEALPIVAEGKIGGYFFYLENNWSNCIFSNDAIPMVLGEISFDSTFQIETAKINLENRDLSMLIYGIVKRIS